MKACVFFIFKICPWIVHVGDWALRWTEGNEALQVFFVMLFFPVIMNALQYYIIDGFIKDQKPSDHEPIPSEDGEVDGDGDNAINDQNRDEAFSSGDEADAIKKSSRRGSKTPSAQKVTKLKVDPKKLDEYNPELDGETSPVDTGSGSSSIDKDVDKSLLAKEAGNENSIKTK